MAINVLDVRDTFAAPRIRVPALRVVVTGSAPSVRRMPAPVLAAGLIAVVEAVGLVALAISGIDGALTSTRPPGWALALALTALSGWVVLCAGGGAVLMEGAGRRLLVGLAGAELVLAPVLLVVATLVPVVPGPTGLPLPGLALVVLAVPVSKALLAGTSSARQWVAAGPRTRERRPDPFAAHRLLAMLTLGVIGASLVVLAVPSPARAPQGGPGAVSSSVVHTDD